MRCNACWRELEGRAVSTTCAHLLCNEDANKILSSEAACPICDQVLSKSLLKSVDINPNDEWINMAMVGISPQICILTCFIFVLDHCNIKVMFITLNDIGLWNQYGWKLFKDLEMQYKINKIVAQCRQKCEVMQEKFTEKLEQVHTAYQKMAKRCQMMEQEIENLSKDKEELQEKFSEKSRQKRKLDEMYDQLRSEFESMKRSAIQPARSFYPRSEPDFFSNAANMMGNRDSLKQDRSIYTPETPGQREDMWPMARQNRSDSGPFDVSAGSTGKQMPISGDSGGRRPGTRPSFGSGGNNPSMTLRNLIISPVKRPHVSCNHTQLFTL